jgi:hypothetical protein
MYLLELTNGETTITLNGGAVCLEFLAWSPIISEWRGGEYPPVAESLPVVIKGATGTAVMTTLRELTRLVDQAKRFSRGENLPPLWLRYQQTAQSRVWTALIVGGRVDAPSNFTNQENWKTLFPVYLELVRDGGWYTQDATELLTNGGFEVWAGDPEQPTGWTLVNGPAIAKEDETVKSGEYSLDATLSVALEQRIAQDVTVTAGLTYKVAAWVWLASGGVTLESYQLSAPVQSVSTTSKEQWVYLFFNTTAVDDTLAVRLFSAGGVSQVYIDDVSVQLLNDTGEAGDTATDAAVDNGELATLQFVASEPFPSPTRVILEDVLLGTNHPRAFLALVNYNVVAPGLWRAEFLQPYNTPPWSVVSDAATFAIDGYVLRYTPANTSWSSLQYASLNVNKAAIFALVRNNSTTTTFYMRMKVADDASATTTKPVAILPRASARPEWIMLGIISRSGANELSFEVSADAASGTLDINAQHAFSLDDGLTSILAIDGPGTGSTAAASEAARLIIDHETLTAPTPSVKATLDGATLEWVARGERSPHTTSGLVYGVLMATGGASTANRWRQEASAAVIANDWTLSRLPARLTPE